jgi:hypothetical protein
MGEIDLSLTLEILIAGVSTQTDSSTVEDQAEADILVQNFPLASFHP